MKIKQTGWNMGKNAPNKCFNLQHRNATKNDLLQLITNNDSPNNILKEEAY
jgi:hypothetical protein